MNKLNLNPIHNESTMSLNINEFKCFAFIDQDQINKYSKLGFTIENKPNGDILYSYKEYRYSLIKKENYDGYLFCDDGNVLRDLEFIHELQNIYFALIVIELKLNND